MSPSTSRGQLALNVQLSDDATFENFLAWGGHAAVVDAVRGQLAAGGDQAIYLAGPTGVGKSHLLQAACHLAGGTAVYLPLAELGPTAGSDLPPGVFDGLEALDLVCVDDLDVVARVPAWERSLFNFYNRASETGCRLLFAARGAPRTLGLDLPDLASRLSWATIYQLPAADELHRVEILQFRAGRRGLRLPPVVARYIMNRSARDMAALIGVLERLDGVSLAEQRRLSVPFVRRALGWT